MSKPIVSCTRLAIALLLATAFAVHAQVFPGKEWRKAESAAAAGWSPEKLKAAEEFGRTLKTDAWMLVHKGVVIHQAGPVDRPSNVGSVRKSVISILVGMHAARGNFPLDKTLAELGVEDRQPLTDTERQATVRHLLQSRSGVYHEAANETAAMKAERPPRGRHAPGTFFYYNNWDFNVLGTVFRQTTGRTVFESLRDDLATPLQLQDFNFDRDAFFQSEQLSMHPTYAMRLSVRDMARVGLLMSRGGQWQGRQLVSPQWVEESTALHSRLGSRNGYGYLWWVGMSDRAAALAPFPGKVFLAAGNLGQFIVVDPVRDIVFVHKVDFERDFTREVTSLQFAELLGKVLQAAPSSP